MLEWKGIQGGNYVVARVSTDLFVLEVRHNMTTGLYMASADLVRIGMQTSTGHATLDDAKAAAVALARQALDELYQAERAALGVEV